MIGVGAHPDRQRLHAERPEPALAHVLEIADDPNDRTAGDVGAVNDLAGRPMQAHSRFAAWLWTTAVIVHGIPLVVHGAAHAQLGIYLPSVLANVYIAVVLYAAPVVAAVLLWMGRIRLGAWLLLASMVGSFVFEGYNHFMVMSPDGALMAMPPV